MTAPSARRRHGRGGRRRRTGSRRKAAGAPPMDRPCRWPAAPAGATGRRRRRDRDDRTRGGLVAGLVLIVLGGFFLVRQFLADVRPEPLVADRRHRPRRPARRHRPAAVTSIGLTGPSRTMGAWSRSPNPTVSAIAAIGVVVGLIVLWRGLADYRSHVRVADTSTSTISSIAAGEVRVSGIVEAAELTLVSLLQSRPCVYYRATVGEGGDRSTAGSGLHRGAVDRVPRPRCVGQPARLPARRPVRRAGPVRGRDRPARRRAGRPRRSPGRLDRVERARPRDGRGRPASGPRPGGRGDLSVAPRPAGRRSYREARLEPGDPVTIVGRALPFSDLADPAGGRPWSGSAIPVDDPEVAADLAAARATGPSRSDAATAWGNAAIAGFGIGRPVSTPAIDPAADPAAACRRGRGGAGRPAASRSHPRPSSSPPPQEVPLLIAYGVPGAVVARSRAAVRGRPPRRRPGHRVGDGPGASASVAESPA